MRTAAFALLLATSLSAADSSPVDVAQELFDAMKSHDANAAKALFIPGATLSTAGKPSAMPIETFVEHIGSGKGVWLERIWNPKVLENGSIAVVWAEYDFHLDGKFSHCGIDSFQMLKTPDGWKIASVSDSRQTAACSPSPLGKP